MSPPMAVPAQSHQSPQSMPPAPRHRGFDKGHRCSECSPHTGGKAEPPERLLFSENLLLTSLMTPTPWAAGGVKTQTDHQESPQTTALGNDLECGAQPGHSWHCPTPVTAGVRHEQHEQLVWSTGTWGAERVLQCHISTRATDDMNRAEFKPTSHEGNGCACSICSACSFKAAEILSATIYKRFVFTFCLTVNL